jgi:guanylate cyclase soluble subunit beta
MCVVCCLKQCNHAPRRSCGNGLNTSADDKGARFLIRFVKEGDGEQSEGAVCDARMLEAASQAHTGTGASQASLASRSLAATGLDMCFFLSQWPFFLVMDGDMAIVAAGPSLQQRVPEAVAGASFHDIFMVERPEAAREASFACVQEHANVSFRVLSRAAIAGGKQLLLRGAMHCLGDGATRHCLFLCSALVLNLDDMVNAHMQMNDFPLHDAARDLLFMSESNAAQNSLLVRLERLSAELAHEQARSDELLFSMLPPTVIDDLREGRRFRGQEWGAVTILFSDIVGKACLAAPASSCACLMRVRQLSLRIRQAERKPRNPTIPRS